MTVDSRATTGSRAAKADATSELKLNNSRLIICPSQREYCSTSLTCGPADVGLDQTGASAHVCKASPVQLSVLSGHEVPTVVFDGQHKVSLSRSRHNHLYQRSICMPADIIHGLLRDAVDLHLNV